VWHLLSLLQHDMTIDVTTASAPAECWRTLPQGRAPDAGEDTLLRSVMGLRARLPDAAGLGGSGASAGAALGEVPGAPRQPALPPARMVHMWSASEPVAGIAWLAARRLAVVSSTATDATLRLYTGPSAHAF
jgi:hypothetical protein